MVDEPETPRARAALNSVAVVATTAVSYVESRAALARMHAGRRLDERDLREARHVLDEVWLDLLTVPTDDALLADAAALSDQHALRGYDAVQLAAAGAVRTADELRFVCFDRELNDAAEAIGLEVA